MFRSPAARVFWISFLILYLELLLIRWLPAHVRILAYFTNILLIAGFAGMGLGCFLRDKRRWLPWFPLIFLAVTFLALAFKSVYIHPSGADVLFLEFQKSAKSLQLYVAIPLFFAAAAALFIPLGQELGSGLESGPPLRGYAVNLLGSLSGILAAAATSLWNIPPLYQFCVFVLLFCVYAFYRFRWVLILQIAALAAGLWAVRHADLGALWSPYHKITLSPLKLDRTTNQVWEKYVYAPAARLMDLPPETGFDLSINDDFLQKPMDLSERSVRDYPFLQLWKDNYDLPYRLTRPRSVLIVGGGAGNDAAAALRHGVPDIEVVDIESLVLEIGLQRHPEKPYAHPAVRLIADDARAYFHKTRKKYDLIVFSYLDSHRLFSQMSSIRLDSFLYTRESFRQASRLLTERGILYVQSAVGSNPWVGDRLYGMLTELYGRPPAIINGALAPAFAAGPDPGVLRLDSVPTLKNPETTPGIPPATDDWPYIYLKRPSIPKEYSASLVTILFLSCFAFAAAGAFLGPPRLHFFFLGAGFFLLETKYVTELALFFGTTWRVNSLVLALILTVSFAAILTVRFRRFADARWAYAALLLCLAAGAFFPSELILALPPGPRLLSAACLAVPPVYLAGLLFSRAFQNSPAPAVDFSLNVLGCVAGGLSEYFSMIFGFRFLALLAALYYVLAWRFRGEGEATR